MRKVYYNLTVTGLSVIAALFIGFIEIAQVIIPKLGLGHNSLGWILNLNFNTMGYILVIIFILVWIISIGGWKLLRVGENEE